MAGNAFYTGTSYPAIYRNRCFFADYTTNWIGVLLTDADDQLTAVQLFGQAMDGPVDIVSDPITRDLYYVAINAGEVRRIRYTSAPVNQPPTAVAGATPDVGVAPLPVQFSSAGTLDPDNDPLQLGWEFGDGGAATGPSPQHTYTVAGTYAAVLTVDDGQGHVVRDTVTVIVASSSGFPTTPVLDTFNRPNGPLSSGWVGDPGGFSIDNLLLMLTAGSSSASFATFFGGATLEAYFTFAANTTTALEENLMLNVQGNNWWDGHIEINYQPRFNAVYVNSYTAGGVGWQSWGGPFPATFSPGDQFGARTYPNGAVAIYKNGVVIGTTSVAGWPHVGQGGRIGLTISDAGGCLWDDFGGGNAAPGPTAVDGSARGLALSAAWPNPSHGRAQLALDLPAPARVEFEVYDLMGRVVWNETSREHGAGRSVLRWPGTRGDGSVADAGIYLARVTVGGRAFTRRFALLH
jgi:PKD repeat protein